MLLKIKTYVITLTLFTVLALSLSIGKAETSFAAQHNSINNELLFKVKGQMLYSDAETGVPSGYTSTNTTNGNHPVKNRDQSFIPVTIIHNIEEGPEVSPAAVTRAVVQDFIPLFRFLIFPKHWFW